MLLGWLPVLSQNNQESNENQASGSRNICDCKIHYGLESCLLVRWILIPRTNFSRSTQTECHESAVTSVQVGLIVQPRETARVETSGQTMSSQCVALPLSKACMNFDLILFAVMQTSSTQRTPQSVTDEKISRQGHTGDLSMSDRLLNGTCVFIGPRPCSISEALP